MDGRIIIVFFIICRVKGQVQNEAIEYRLHALEAQVKKLVDMKAKLDKIEDLLQDVVLLCGKENAVSKPERIDDDKDDKKLDPEKQNEVQDKVGRIDFVPSISNISVESGGLVYNTIQVTVGFWSEKTCAVTWNVMHKGSNFLAWEGDIYEKKLDGNRKFCAGMIELTEVNRIEWLYTNIYGINDHVQLTFNITALQEEGIERIDELKYRILKYSPVVFTSADGVDSEGIETVVKVSSNLIDRIEGGYPSTAHAIFQYVNTTARPAEIMTKFMYEDIALDIKDGSTDELVLRLKQDIADFGGLLYLSAMQGGTFYLDNHQHDVYIRVLHKGTNKIMPEGVIAVTKQKEIQYYRGQYYSVRCVGASIPEPDVQIYKVKSDGNLKQLSVDADVFGDLFHYKVVNFVPGNIEHLDGEYACRVSLGNKSVDQRFTVLKYEEIQFDEMRTRVVENSRTQMIISCNATGIPTPDVELLVNDPNGKDMIKSTDVGSTHTFTTYGNSVEVMMKIKPINPDIHTVVCVAYQWMDGQIVFERSFPIEIKPF